MDEGAYTTCELTDGVAVLTLNRPERMNAMGDNMREELIDRIEQAAADPAVRAVLITGAGRAFCAGRDMKEAARGGAEKPRPEARLPNRLGHYTSLIRRMKKPVIAAVNGPAYGGGWSLALACDIRIASERAVFSMAFIHRGALPVGGATYVLPRLIGTAKACELVMTGDPVGAQEALRLGLVNRVVPHARLMDEALGLARRLAAGPPAAIALAKASIYRS
ncbi:MAG: enoyl-CoA hydratase/isomerase family protein, partial [Candidatus Lambdaproteobacteria bacterium]|nr:enoyl-CoA hydratase/isomerase family protein [Candidatus Lambdaproteobacteria bacterium]